MKKKANNETGMENRNDEMGSTTTDKAFKDTKTLKRHQGVPNAGGVRTGQTKKENQ